MIDLNLAIIIPEMILGVGGGDAGEEDHHHRALDPHAQWYPLGCLSFIVPTFLIFFFSSH